MRLILTMAVTTLMLGAPALGQASPEAPKVYMQEPTGDGDPTATTCRPPQRQPNSRIPGPEVCKTNAQWARYRKDGMDVAADGIHDVPSEKRRNINPQACRPATMGGSSTSGAMATNFSVICE